MPWKTCTGTLENIENPVKKSLWTIVILCFATIRTGIDYFNIGPENAFENLDMYKFYNDAVPSIIEKIQTFNIDIETSVTMIVS